MSTINRLNAARKNSFIGQEFAREDKLRAEHKKEEEFPLYLRRAKPEKKDRYTSRKNICDKCHTTKALQTQECLCDDD